MHGADVMIVELERIAFSGDDGSYEFENVPPGQYHVIAHLDHIFAEEAKRVEIEAGIEASLDFLLSVTADKQQITVTASEHHETTLESFQDVESFDALDLAEAGAVSIGEVFDNKVGTGIAKRSFGPGASRPIIRGFDGDRVLMMEDGMRTGSLSAQSGDHGELINVAQLDRLEVVKGPATLLYSGNAIGGTVNAISRHHEHHRHPHQGLRGYLTGAGGTTNSLASGNAGFEYGTGRVQIWGHGGSVRTGDYGAPEMGPIYNSRSQILNSGGGVGWYGEKAFFTVEAKADRGNAGLPFGPELHGHDEHGHEGEDDEEEEEEEEEDDHEEELDRISVPSRRESFRATWGLQHLGSWLEGVQLKLNYVDWGHEEVEYFEDGDSFESSIFRNKRFAYRGVFEQAVRGKLHGRFGFWGVKRDYTTAGEEALSPPTAQDGLAFFALEELDFERFKLQFGGRVETQRYRPVRSEHEEEEEEDDDHGHAGHDHGEEAPEPIERTFTGLSLAAGLHADVGTSGAIVANFSHSYRAPALEELYNFGPHVGSAAFEIGNPNLDAERGNGFDLSLRRGSGRVRSEVNFFYYDFENFIFPFANGHEIDGLAEIEYTQRHVRYTGSEANLGVGLMSALRLNFGLDYVNAKEIDTDTHLPRIPPLRGRVGLDFRAKGLQIAPELIMAAEQNRTFDAETSTPGYTVMNLKASYTYPQQHVVHQFAVNVFNAGNHFYRNHTSFIKDLAPEMGRGLRFTYSLRWF